MIKRIVMAVVSIGLIFNNSCSVKPKIVDVSNKKIVFISKMKSSGYWDVVKMGAEAAASEFNVKLEIVATDSEEDVQGQIRLLEESLNKDMDALILAPNDFDTLTKTIEQIHENKVPVVIIDSKINTDKISCFIGTDNIEAGRAAGKELIKHIGESGNIAIIGFAKGNVNGKDREEGLKNVLSQYPNIKVLAKEYSPVNSNYAASLLNNIIIDHPELNAIVALDAVSSEAAAETVLQRKLEDKIKVIGFDSSVKEIELLEKGAIKTTITQNPFNMGYLAVKNSVLSIKGESVPKKIDILTTIINKENMYMPENEKLLFPFVK